MNLGLEGLGFILVWFLKLFRHCPWYHMAVWACMIGATGGALRTGGDRGRDWFRRCMY